LVTGALRSRNPEDLLMSFRANEFDFVITCMPPTPRGLSAEEMAKVAQSIGCIDVRIADSVENACQMALNLAQEDDAILVTGSLYIVSAARPYLLSHLAKHI
ncbi:MAG: glutamate ligase domain-containing protein, partial [Acidimicrobiaceae bacterium]